MERSLQAGLIAGTIGYTLVTAFVAVAAWLDAGSSFSLTALLRSTLFLPTQAGAEAMVVTGPTFAYAGPRLVTFLVAGVFMGWLASIVERAPQAWLVAGILLVFVGVPVVGLPIFLEQQTQPALSTLLVTIATAFATVAMASYLWIVHPVMRTVIRSARARRTDC